MSMLNAGRAAALGLMVLAAPTPALGATAAGGPYVMTSGTLDGGGGRSDDGSALVLECSIGQALAGGPLEAGSYGLVLGFQLGDDAVDNDLFSDSFE